MLVLAIYSVLCVVCYVVGHFDYTDLLFIIYNMIQAGSGECSCGGKLVQGLSVKPTKGNAVLFWSMVSAINLLIMDAIRVNYEIGTSISLIVLVLLCVLKVVPLGPRDEYVSLIICKCMCHYKS